MLRDSSCPTAFVFSFDQRTGRKMGHGGSSWKAIVQKEILACPHGLAFYSPLLRLYLFSRLPRHHPWCSRVPRPVLPNYRLSVQDIEGLRAIWRASKPVSKIFLCPANMPR